MPAVLDPAQVDLLVSDLRMKEDSFVAATNENDAFQAAALEAVASAAAKAQAKTVAHDELSVAIDNLISYLETLR